MTEPDPHAAAGDPGSDSPSHVPHPAIRRLSLYLRQLEAFAAQNRHTDSSRDLGRALGLGDAQVRKDLANFGSFGQSGVGYRVGELVGRLKRILGVDRSWDVVLMGAGNVGRALLAYRPFVEKGFRLVAVFDSNPRLHGQEFGGVMVQPPSEVSETVRRLGAQLAVIAVPAEAAQRAADRGHDCRHRRRHSVERAAARIRALLPRRSGAFAWWRRARPVHCSLDR